MKSQKNTGTTHTSYVMIQEGMNSLEITVVIMPLAYMNLNSACTDMKSSRPTTVNIHMDDTIQHAFQLSYNLS